MRHTRNTLVMGFTCVILAVLMWLPGHLQAAELDTRNRHWPGQVYYYVGTDCPKDFAYDIIDQVAQEAAEFSVPMTNVGTWNSLARDSRNTHNCSPENPMDEEALSVYDPEIGEEYSYVYADDTENLAIATTRTRFYRESGVIIEFDIWYDSDWSQEEWMFYRLARHELGHGLGLSHSEFEGTLMYPTATINYWDIETIARLALTYGRCETRVDEMFNLWIPAVEGKYTILAADQSTGTWGVTTILGDTSCVQ